MRFLFKVGGIFFLSLLLIFALAACGGKDTPETDNKDGSSSENEPSSIITGATDNEDNIDIGDIFGNDSSSQSGDSSSNNSSGNNSSASSSDSGNSSQSSSDSGSSSSGSSSGIDYEDPSVWTDPV